jgi:hypothetical protein
MRRPSWATSERTLFGAWLARHAPAAEVAEDDYGKQDDDENPKPGRHVILSLGRRRVYMASRPYLQRADSRPGDISEPRSTLLGRVTIHVGEEGGEYWDEKLMTQTGGAESARNLPDLANEGASDEEAVGDTIRALVNHGWVHDRHRRPGDDAHSAARRVRAAAADQRSRRGCSGGEPARARSELRAVI